MLLSFSSRYARNITLRSKITLAKANITRRAGSPKNCKFFGVFRRISLRSIASHLQPFSAVLWGGVKEKRRSFPFQKRIIIRAKSCFLSLFFVSFTLLVVWFQVFPRFLSPQGKQAVRFVFIRLDHLVDGVSVYSSLFHIESMGRKSMKHSGADLSQPIKYTSGNAPTTQEVI